MSATVQSVERAAAMLRLLADENEPIGLAQIASALGLAKGTAHGLLRTLQDVGFIEQTFPTGPYRVAPEIFRLGWARLDLNELRSKALNWTDALAARTGESARVAAFADGQAVVAHHVFRPDLSDQVLLTGSAVPLHASALGKVLLAFDPGAARSIMGKPLPGYTFRTIIDRVALQRDLASIRDQGWAAAVEESAAGVTGVAAPIRDGGGYVVAAVGIEGDTNRMCDERSRPRPALVSHVIRAGRSISRELGHGREW
ncbi:DNA-binding transcriptional regulator, IclR family [Nakamurella panacisegetis]|uniref:Glycerol operon regulatory protein n=1 Tax=Nakamurella panacisegetis TaxID=1090615 RepID=A0A1H0PDN7_9ACTN|nr:IclR family transcriptional regulator [Nakamurella panacisegetis]SDP03237.1 DNA-binding transcriptional regulator, IclR family [Nakamurella panacisegetis]